MVNDGSLSWPIVSRDWCLLGIRRGRNQHSSVPDWFRVRTTRNRRIQILVQTITVRYSLACRHEVADLKPSSFCPKQFPDVWPYQGLVEGWSQPPTINKGASELLFNWLMRVIIAKKNRLWLKSISGRITFGRGHLLFLWQPLTIAWSSPPVMPGLPRLPGSVLAHWARREPRPQRSARSQAGVAVE